MTFVNFVCIYVCEPHASLVPNEIRRKCWMPETGVRWLWAAREYWESNTHPPKRAMGPVNLGSLASKHVLLNITSLTVASPANGTKGHTVWPTEASSAIRMDEEWWRARREEAAEIVLIQVWFLFCFTLLGFLFLLLLTCLVTLFSFLLWGMKQG